MRDHSKRLNHARQRIRPSRCGCNRSVLRTGSPSLGPLGAAP
jgi:hypothetical protein